MNMNNNNKRMNRYVTTTYIVCSSMIMMMMMMMNNNNNNNYVQAIEMSEIIEKNMIFYKQQQQQQEENKNNLRMNENNNNHNNEKESITITREEHTRLVQEHNEAFFHPIVSQLNNNNNNEKKDVDEIDELLLPTTTTTTTTATQRIIGGQPVRGIIGNDPEELSPTNYMVELNVVTPWQERVKWCGATLIAKNFVLTTAHCIMTIVPGDKLVAHLGDMDYGDMEHASYLEMDVKQVMINEHYFNPLDAIDGDIALIQLMENIPEENDVVNSSSDNMGMKNMLKPIPMLTKQFVKSVVPGANAQIFGYGKTGEEAQEEEDVNKGSDTLQQATIKIISNEKCQNSYSTVSNNNNVDMVIQKDMLCAGKRNGGADVCQGDSGGPLVMKINDEMMLVGVITKGLGCGKKKHYSIYTRVSEYSDWIQSIIV